MTGAEMNTISWVPVLVSILMLVINLVTIPSIKYIYRRDQDQLKDTQKTHTADISQLRKDQNEIKDNYLDRFKELNDTVNKYHNYVITRFGDIELKIEQGKKKGV